MEAYLFRPQAGTPAKTYKPHPPPETKQNTCIQNQRQAELYILQHGCLNACSSHSKFLIVKFSLLKYFDSFRVMPTMATVTTTNV